jgi:hypothetical protein
MRRVVNGIFSSSSSTARSAQGSSTPIARRERSRELLRIACANHELDKSTARLFGDVLEDVRHLACELTRGCVTDERAAGPPLFCEVDEITVERVSSVTVLAPQLPHELTRSCEWWVHLPHSAHGVGELIGASQSRACIRQGHRRVACEASPEASAASRRDS